VAADQFAWNVGWGTGQGKAGFQLARDVLQSKVEDVEIDVMQLSPQAVGTFDVVLFLGVLYHVKEPLSALERVASVTRDLLIVETVVDMVGIARQSPGAARNAPRRRLHLRGNRHADAVVRVARPAGGRASNQRQEPLLAGVSSGSRGGSRTKTAGRRRLTKRG